jgi:hypothetical protein
MGYDKKKSRKRKTNYGDMVISAKPTFLTQGSMQVYLAYRYRQTGAPVQCLLSTS